MGCWDCFCCFCSGPFENPREEWIRHLREDTPPEEWPLGSKLRECNDDDSIPTEIIDGIVTLSERDGAVWEHCVCVTSEAPESFVSPPWQVSPTLKLRDILYTSINLSLAGLILMALLKSRAGIENYTLMNRYSLSIQQLWESFHGEGSRYRLNGDDLMNGLLHCVDYGEMTYRAGQVFEYDFWEIEEGDASSPEPTKVMEWLFARPTFLPAPQKLQLLTIEGPTPGRRVFEIPELLDNILEHIVDVPANVIQSELKASDEIFEAPSAVTAAKALVSLAQVNRSFYQAIVGNRQGLFLKATRNFGWMLPFSPADWSDSEWPDAVLEDTALARGSKIDWRAYMLKCIRKTTPNIRNRWRLHKMAVRFARGRNGHGSNCVWNAGSLGFKPDLQKSDANGWEVDVRWW
ncbi:hypothetical protein F53441_7262 [Fusarium austroafricanum]|uniref:Uncharacterized protein n=1 Tax=Fusarium austroafricanum TaxID=2364996 RepID=A0A8H4KGY8_9HYPO|nr:hypothetical protein F53441_7262 [Fusarium austroafricanum]